jgi:hypothetical protein
MILQLQLDKATELGILLYLQCYNAYQAQALCEILVRATSLFDSQLAIGNW